MKSVMTHSFSTNPKHDIQRSKFDRSFGWKGSFDAGNLIPFYIDDVLPGDTFTLQTTGFARLSSPYFPVMDNMFMDTHFFFVPLRLVWDNARRFFGERDNPADSIDYTIPQFTPFVPSENSVTDYMGVATEVGKNVTINSIYHRGMNLCYNHWFRDQNLIDSVTVDTGDGPDAIANYGLLKRAKRGDYFTTALPWPQKGDAVNIPLGTSAPITGIGVNAAPTAGPLNVNETDGTGVETYANYWWGTNIFVEQDTTNLGYPNARVNLTDAVGANVNDMREAFQVQRLLEHDARGGTRYAEIVSNHFGVDFYDVAYRPEFLGGGSTPINFTPVAETTASATGNPGKLSAFATSIFKNHGFTKSFREHGFIIGFVSVRADLTYQQGVPRHFIKQTRYDYYWPTLAHLGEQEIFNQEIFHSGVPATDDAIFGYQERYAEYRYKPSCITGSLRSTAATPLDAWHLSQEFSVLPVLGQTFIEETPPIDRVVRVPSEPHFIFDSFTKLICARPMPVFGVPGMIDHF